MTKPSQVRKYRYNLLYLLPTYVVYCTFYVMVFFCYTLFCSYMYCLLLVCCMLYVIASICCALLCSYIYCLLLLCYFQGGDSDKKYTIVPTEEAKKETEEAKKEER